MENRYHSHESSNPEQPSAEAIDNIASGIEDLRGPRNEQGDARLYLDPDSINTIISQTSEQRPGNHIVKAFFDATGNFTTSLVMQFQNGDELIYSLDGCVAETDAGAHKTTISAGDSLDNTPVAETVNMTSSDLNIVTEAYGHLVETLPPLQARLFQSAAERLIAHGEIDDLSNVHERALFEDRSPASFTYDFPLETLPLRTTQLTERVHWAELSFIERRIDEGASPEDEPLPDTVTLTIGSFDVEGHLCETVYLLQRKVGTDNNDVEGSFLRLVQRQNKLEDLEDFTDSELYHELTDGDLSYMKEVIELLPDTPSMESHSDS